MSIRSILAAYSGDAKGSSALPLAIHMAHKYGAHLTGVVAHGRSVFEDRYNRYMSSEVLDILRGRDAERVDEIRADFEARVAAAGGDVPHSFLDLHETSGFRLAECSRTYDLLVIGCRAAEAGSEHFTERPDEVALSSGRPVILVPQNYQVERLGEHALIAWDGGRAAARALGDAMNILETKSKVTVLTVNRPAQERPGDDVVALLQRHGIQAERMRLEARRSAVAGTILDACAESGAGLLVMGAYEHSKFSEDIFGGVTQDILQQANLPVLMSH